MNAKATDPASTQAAAKPAVGCKAWRRANLRALFAKSLLADAQASLPARGAAKRMAAKLSLAPAALSNMIHGVKNIGDEAARAIEERLGEAPGSLDAPSLCLAFETQEELDRAKAILAKAAP